MDENWIEAKLGEKVGVCPLQFTEVSSAEFLPFFFFLSPAAYFLNAILQAPSRLTTRQFGPLLCNESDGGCSYLCSISSRSQPGRHLLFFFESRVEFKSAICLKKICLGIKTQSSLRSPAASAAGRWCVVHSQVPVVLLSSLCDSRFTFLPLEETDSRVATLGRARRLTQILHSHPHQLLL